jgi:hypothetical protein
MDFVILDKALTTLSFITPFILYGGMLLVLSMNKSSYDLCGQYFHSLILGLKEYLLFKRFLNGLHMGDHKH